MVSRKRSTNRVTRPLEERINLYHKTVALSNDGFRRGEIVREMWKRYGALMDSHQVVDWTERGVSPYGRLHKFDAVPTPELAYLCGVKLGDATQSKGTWQHSYKLRLLAIDEEFVQEFSRCASRVLKCNPFKVWWYNKRGMWCAEACSVLLYKFLKEGLPRFKALVSHCPDCAAAFIRGFFDSEASVTETGLTVSNGHPEVLVYIQHLLMGFFGIETTGPHPSGPPPGTFKQIKGRTVRVNLQSYTIRVRNACISKFAKSVGFSIFRKSRNLDSLAVRLHSNG